MFRLLRRHRQESAREGIERRDEEIRVLKQRCERRDEEIRALMEGRARNDEKIRLLIEARERRDEEIRLLDEARERRNIEIRLLEGKCERRDLQIKLLSETSEGYKRRGFEILSLKKDIKAQKQQLGDLRRENEKLELKLAPIEGLGILLSKLEALTPRSMDVGDNKQELQLREIGLDSEEEEGPKLVQNRSTPPLGFEQLEALCLQKDQTIMELKDKLSECHARLAQQSQALSSLDVGFRLVEALNSVPPQPKWKPVPPSGYLSHSSINGLRLKHYTQPVLERGKRPKEEWWPRWCGGGGRERSREVSPLIRKFAGDGIADAKLASPASALISSCLLEVYN
ncbi:hypothetical protein NMY22_g2077 [Coprinellus aureogranulatus]|nr:hypothetical protein NMY22_g2077 [Coprinellus aureogranulatus]